MTDKTIDKIVQRQLKWYTAEVILLWFLTGIGAVLIITGVGVYFYVNRITITQYLSAIHVNRFAISQVKMLHDFSKVLGIVFALVGVVSIVFALDRLGLKKAAHRMAVYIRDSKEQS